MGNIRQKNPNDEKESAVITPQLDLENFLPDDSVADNFTFVKFTEALLEYAKPIVQLLENNDDALQKAIAISQDLWNNVVQPNKMSEQSSLLKVIAKMEKEKIPNSNIVANKMIKRHHILFPFIQSDEGPMIRMCGVEQLNKEYLKEDQALSWLLEAKFKAIDPFEFKRLRNDIRKLEKTLQRDDWDDELYCEITEELLSNFFVILIDIGLSNVKASSFCFCMETFLEYIWDYSSSRSLNELSASEISFFMEDYFLNKTMVEPPTLQILPSALKVFIRFLDQNGLFAQRTVTRIMKQMDELVLDYFDEVEERKRPRKISEHKEDLPYHLIDELFQTLLKSSPYIRRVKSEREKCDENENSPLSVNGNLQSILSNQPITWINGICRSLETSLKGKKKDKITEIIVLLTHPNKIKEILYLLPEESVECLTFVLEQGGWVELAILESKYDSISEDGWYWLKKPPLSTIGMLRRYGFLFVGKDNIEGHLVQIAIVPRDLRSFLCSILNEMETNESINKK